MKIFCRGTLYRQEERFGTLYPNRGGTCSGTSMSGHSLGGGGDGGRRVGFSSPKTLTEDERKARETADKLADAKALLAEVEEEERAIAEAEAEVAKKAKEKAAAIAEAKVLVAEAERR